MVIAILDHKGSSHGYSDEISVNFLFRFTTVVSVKSGMSGIELGFEMFILVIVMSSNTVKLCTFE